MRYQAIDEFRTVYPVRLMCRCLRVSSSGYYAWRGRAVSTTAASNQVLRKQIKDIHTDSDGVFGSGRIRDELYYDGVHCSLNRIARLMREQGLRGIPQKRRWLKKSNSERPEGVENHLNRQFSADEPNRKWVTDITYIPTAEGWLYLCIVKDLCTAVVVGWSMSSRQDTQLVLHAVMMAMWQKSSSDSVILHSDRGTQFTSQEYQRFLIDHSITSSMSAVGSCADNAAAEGFFGMLKRERVNRRRYKTRAEATADVFDYIERFYNPARRRKMNGPKSDEMSLTQPSTESG